MPGITTGFSSRKEANVLIECECENCGNAYQYKTVIYGIGEANYGFGEAGKNIEQVAADKAMQDLQKNILAAQEEIAEGNFRRIGFERCPQCGAIQSWMLTAARLKLSNRISTIFVLIGVILMSFICLSTKPIGIAWYYALGVFFVVLILGLGIESLIKRFYIPKGYHKTPGSSLPTIRFPGDSSA